MKLIYSALWLSINTDDSNYQVAYQYTVNLPSYRHLDIKADWLY